MFKKATIAFPCGLLEYFFGMHYEWYPENQKNSHVVYPSGKPMIQHLLHPRLLQR
jgi:hypothetical protein